jgi:spore germination protein GerM
MNHEGGETRMPRKPIALALIAALLLVLTGCTERLLQERADARVLPSMRPGPTLPAGDVQATQSVNAVFYIPDWSRQRLVAHQDEIQVPVGASLQEAVLLKHLELLRPAFPALSQQELSLQPVTNALELSDGLATVSLSWSTRRLSNKEQFVLRMAITNTLTELPGIQYVDVLVNGRDEGTDLAATIPCGVLTRYPSGDIEGYWSQVENQNAQTGAIADLSKTAALYFVTADGRFLLPEVRTLVFHAYDQNLFLQTLLDELANGSVTHPGATIAVVPPSTLSYMLDAPEIVTVSGSAYKFIHLSFRREIDDYLTVMGGSRAMLLASLAYSLLGFMPGADGVVVTIDKEQITQVQTPDGQIVQFESSWMTRADFGGLTANLATLYFPLLDGTGLGAVRRPVAERLAGSPRALLQQLLAGPQPFDGRTDVAPLFPNGGEPITDADILSIALEEDAALVNLSQAFAEHLSAWDPAQARAFVYSAVNTLTGLRGVRRVRFYVEGQQAAILSGAAQQEPAQGFSQAFSLEGEFLRNPGLIRPESSQ